MVRRWFVGVLFAVTTMFVGQAAATVVSPLNFDELVKSADIVVHGFVVEQWTEAPDGLPGLIYTYTLVEVAQTLKGEPEKRMTLRHIGGDLGGLLCQPHWFARIQLRVRLKSSSLAVIMLRVLTSA